VPEDAAKVFDEYAGDYAATVNAAIAASGEDSEFFADLKAVLVREALGDHVRTLLDFGCGVGGSTRALARAFPASRISGWDVSPESIARARALGGERLDFSAGSEGATQLPFPDARFDAAFTACVFHHIPREEHARWARELHRAIAPGGTLVLFEHNPWNPLTRKVVRDCPFDEGVILLRPGYARRLLREAGFTVSRPRYYFFFPHLLRALRPLERLLRWLPLGGQYFLEARRVSASPAP
jgi:SAM-dependent methyltransferase